MGFGRSRLPSERAQLVEAQLRERVVELRPRGTALGICRVCETIVYAGDRLAMTSCYVLHDGCIAGSAERTIQSA